MVQSINSIANYTAVELWMNFLIFLNNTEHALVKSEGNTTCHNTKNQKAIKHCIVAWKQAQ